MPMWWSRFSLLVRGKLQSLALGLSLGLGILLLGQPCVGTGQCTTCGACLTRVPIALLPLLGVVGVTLVQRTRTRLENTRVIGKLTRFFDSH